MSNKQIRLLYVEDDDAIREEGLRHLRSRFPDIEFTGAPSFEEAVALHDAHKNDFVISDFIFPGKDSQYGGRDFVAHLRQQGDDTPVAIYSRSKPEFIKDKFKEAAIEVPGNRTILVEKIGMRLADVVALMKKRYTQPGRPTDVILEPFWIGRPNSVG